MKIGKSEMHCGECSIIDHCGEPFSDIAICCESRFEDVEQDVLYELLEKSPQGDQRERIEHAFMLLEEKMSTKNYPHYKNTKDLQDYKVFIGGEWYRTKLNKEKYELIQQDLRGEIGFAQDIVLENGDVVEIGIIDDILPL